MENQEEAEALSYSSEDNKQVVDEPIDYSNRLKLQYRIPFPSVHYAETAMRAIGVDPPFMDSKTRKTTIKREMWVEDLDDGVAYLNIILSCIAEANDGKEVNSLRTCQNSMMNNLNLVCQTMKEFGV